MKVLHVVGARPNFMKAAPVHRALCDYPEVEQILVHTGQHYDVNMSDVFFQQLGLPAPDVNLEVGSGTHAQQTAKVMLGFEPVVLEHKPDIVLVYGDVNSTVAAALVCSKLGVRVGHVEAGLRSFDRSMPEEINRILTDQLADLLFTPSIDGNENLQREGVPEEKIFLVGNVMIDTLVRLLPEAASRSASLHKRLGLHGDYGLVTLHRPSNVDDDTKLKLIMQTLDQVSEDIQLLFPVHPRTRNRIQDLNINLSSPRLKFTEPLSYLDFLSLMADSRFVITDSGGVQEETTYLGVPCLTIRKNTERPMTMHMGTNILLGEEYQSLLTMVPDTLSKIYTDRQIPPLWDGVTSHRIAKVVFIT